MHSHQVSVSGGTDATQIDKGLKAFVFVLAGKSVGQRVGVVYAELVVFLIASTTCTPFR